MKTNLINTVEELLKTDADYLAEDGKLLKAKVYSDVMTMNPALIELLLSDKKVVEHYFVKVSDTLVFDKQKFAWLLESKEFLPDSYTSYSNKIGLTNNREFISKKNEVVLSFPYKDCVLEGGQDKEDQKRNEIFYNETIASDEITRMLAPKVFTNAKRYTKDGVEENISFNQDDNLIIKGNNLIALSSLLKRYEGRIKCIYIDPPYNTGSDSFNYNDNFNHSSWLTFMRNRLIIARRLLSEDGIIWVQTDDKEVNYLGVLLDEIFGTSNFINIVTVKTKIGGVSGSSEGKSLKDTTEFIQVYAKDKSSIMLEPVYAMTPVWDYIQEEYIEQGKSWKYTSVLTYLGERMLIRNDKNAERKYYHYPDAKSVSVKQYALEHNLTEEEVYNSIPHKIFRTTNAQSSVRTTVMNETKNVSSGVVSIEYVPTKGKNKDKLIEILYTASDTTNMYMFLSDMLTEDKDGNLLYKEKLSTLWDDIQYNNLSKEGKVDFPNGKKPEKLIQNIIEISSYKGDTILDFFGGSGSAAAVAHKLGRKWITIEQLETQIDIMVERLKNVISGDDINGISLDINWQGGGSFVYCELKEDANTLISLIQSANEENILEIRDSILGDSRIIDYISTSEIVKENEDFEALSLEDKKKVLIRLINKNKLYVNYSDIEDEEYEIDDEDKAFTKSFYDEVKL